MLETVLEQVLLRFLAPYVVGISRDSLRVGVFRGLLELQNLRLKPDALALLGYTTLRVSGGYIGRLRLRVPWKHLYSGKVSVFVEVIHFEVERIGDGTSPGSDVDLIREMREAKEKAIAVRASQLVDLVRQRDEDEQAAGATATGDGSASAPKRQGFVAKLIRKIVSNVHVEIEDARASFRNANSGLACSVELGGLDVVSTDANFQPGQRDGKGRGADEVVAGDGALYKLFSLREVGFRMAAAGVSDLSDAEYVLHPVSACLRLAHEPRVGLLHTSFEVAREDILELTLVRSQVKHLRRSQALRGREYMRLYRLMVPEQEEKKLYRDAHNNLAEYAELYERHLLIKRGVMCEGVELLSRQEQKKLQLFEDALAIGRLARRRVLVQQKVDAAIHEAKRQREQAAGAAQGSRGLLGRLAEWATSRSGRGAAEGGSPRPLATPLAVMGQSPTVSGPLGFTADDQERLERDFGDESKFEKVDMPTCFNFEFLLGKLAVDMIDDRWSRQDQRQVLSLALEEARVVVSLDFATDHHGRDASQWCLEVNLGAFHAFQAAQVAFRFCREPRRAPQATLTRRPTTRLGPFGLGSDAAQLVVTSELGTIENVLKLHFTFAKTEIHMPQGLVEEVREFIRADVETAAPASSGAAGSSDTARADEAPQTPRTPTPSPRANPIRRLHRTMSDLSGDEQTSKVADIVYDTLPNAVGSRDVAKSLAKSMYERIPDKLELDVRIASPMFHVPVPGQGTTTFSLGLFHLQTPEPCEYSNLTIHFKLTEMVLYAVTKRGERFDMFQPSLFDVRIEYNSTDRGSMVTVGVETKRAGVTLVPQSLQMLMATPFAMASVMWEKEQKERLQLRPTVRPVTPSLQGAEAEEGAQAARTSGEEPEDGEGRAEAPIGPMDTAAAEAGCPEPDEEPSGGDGDEAPPAPERQFIFNMTLQFHALDLTLADSVVPVMIWRMHWRAPGMKIERHRLPIPKMDVDLAFASEIDIINPRNNAWEPLIERFDGAIMVERRSPGDDRHTQVTISGRDQLLLNLKPSMVRRVSWFVPFILTGLTFEQDLVVTSSDAQTADVSKYRVVNLCNQTLELEFKSSLPEPLVTQVEPTGSKWEHIDKWVVSPYFATALVVRLPNGESSLPLSLEHDGAVAIPNSGFVAELLSPSPLDRMQHRMLLLATSLRVHNQTDLPLLVRFHTADTEVLAAPLPPTMSCDAALLGCFPKEHAVPCESCQLAEASDSARAAELPEHVLVLPPNALGALPLPALVRQQGEDVGASNAWISLRPRHQDFDFCGAVELGASTDPKAIACRRRVEGERAVGSVHFFCESRRHKSTAPSPITLTTIAIRPPLAFTNALPFGELVVSYMPKAGEQECWQEAKVPNLKCLNLYNFPGMLLEDGISIRARLSRGGPWSPLQHFPMSAIIEGGATRTVQLRQAHEGAPGGVVVEHIDGLEFRFSCPFWFVDRSGAGGLRLLHSGRPLPCESGITLLPHKCQEEDCELSIAGQAALMDCSQVMCGRHMCSSSGIRVDRATGTTSFKLRMPASFSILCVRTRCGPGVFCVQAEDVRTADMLGAECQVMNLRPRLLLTNASEHELEIQPVNCRDGDPFKLAPEESREFHWHVKAGDEDAPSTSIRFRPVCRPECQWSGAVLCSDTAAGSRPFLMLAAPIGKAESRHSNADAPSKHLGVEVPQVWSAEVAPVRGSLAVTLRVGSTFAAVNRSSRIKVMVRPLDSGRPIADIPVPVGAEEVPFGWSNPFQDSGAFAVDAIIGGKKYPIEDVRRTKQKRFDRLRVAFTITRVGTKTLLAVEDDLPSGAPRSPAKAEGGKSTMQIDLKLSRVGISLIEEVPQPREFLYVHLDLIRFEWRKESEKDTKCMKFLISAIQVDCQLPDRVDMDSMARSLSFLRQDRPAVILANCGHGDSMFLKLLIEREATSSADIMVPRAEVAVDMLDITIDDGWLDPLVKFAAQCRSSEGGQAVHLADIRGLAGTPAIESYSPPALPSVVQVQALQISQLRFSLWSSLKLRSMDFLPSYVRRALTVLSLGDELTLEDLSLSLPERPVKEHRGSLRDFLRGLGNEYAMNLLHLSGVALGRSSLLNLPRVPWRIGTSTVSYLTDTMGLVAGEAASLMNHLTFDDAYVERQRQIRSQKRIHGFAEGMNEAGRSLGQGIEGVLDVVKKPAEGYKAGGWSGAFVGVGQGVASGLVKPISNLGQAISDVGAGISASVGHDTANAQRRRARPRLRLPRLLFADAGIIRPWSGLEAELLWQFGDERMQGIQEILCLAQEGQRFVALLLYTKHAGLVEIEVRTSEVGGSSSSGSVAKADDTAAGAAEKIFWQALKPVTKLVKSMQELNQGGLDPRHAWRSFSFDNLRDVVEAEDGSGPALDLVDMEGQRFLHLPLSCGPTGTLPLAVRQGLRKGFASALVHPDSAANWGELRRALREEQRSQQTRTDAGEAVQRTDAGQLTLEVFEVERFMLTSGEWQTPCLPTEDELKWRWVDAKGRRHPHLPSRQKMSRQEVVRKPFPPCELDAIFQSVGEWTVERGPGTDEHGWSYALSWKSSTWEAKPGIFDFFRKRKWCRTYR